MAVAAASLAHSGWAVLPDFLPPGAIANLRAESQLLHRDGHFRPAGIGHGGELHADVRGDEVFWFDAETAPVASRLAREEFEALRSAINAANYLGLYEFEAHYAVYPSGTGYAKHLDGFRAGNLRVVSLVLYLNDAWSGSDGGELVLYPARGADIKVTPQGGTLVCFLSETVPHEVLPARRTRLSLTGWFRRRP